MFAELNVLMDTIEAATELKVVVFESANPDYFVAHYDLERGGVIPEQPGAAEFSAWPKFVHPIGAVARGQRRQAARPSAGPRVRTSARLRHTLRFEGEGRARPARGRRGSRSRRRRD